MHLLPEEVVPPLLRMGSAVASVVSMLVGLLVLVGGWGFDLEAIKAVVPGLATMKANTALAFALGGAALWALRDEAASILLGSHASTLPIQRSLPEYDWLKDLLQSGKSGTMFLSSA